MSERDGPGTSAPRWLALDIGGANLKAAHSDGQRDGAIRGLAATRLSWARQSPNWPRRCRPLIGPRSR